MTEADPFEIEVVDVRGVPTKVFRHAPTSLRTIWDLSAVPGPNDYLDLEGIGFGHGAELSVR